MKKLTYGDREGRGSKIWHFGGEVTFKWCLGKKRDDINIKKELNYVNLLFLKHNLMELGFYPFQVTEMISIRRDYFSTLIISSDRK